jgi:hypothetical protein
MIYTLGRKESYDKYIKDDINAAKGVGGSVWQYKEDAEKHLNPEYPIIFEIYGVEAKWRIDTKDIGENWDELLIEGKLVKL